MAARYWRLSLVQSNPPTQLWLTELYFLDAGLADLSSTIGGTTADYGTSVGVGNDASKLFDRSLSTHFVTSNTGLAGYHFNSAVDVAFVDITTYSSLANIPQIDTLCLATSLNGVDWDITHKLSLLSGTWAESQTCRFTVNPITEGLDVQIMGTNRVEPVELNSIIFNSFRLINSGSSCEVDAYDQGKYKIFGYVKVFPDNPTMAKVTLFDQVSHRVMRQVYSNPITGYFEFNYIRNGMFYAIAEDITGTYNGEIFTDLQPIGIN